MRPSRGVIVTTDGSSRLARARLVEIRLVRLNRLLFVFRVGMYVAAGLGLLGVAGTEGPLLFALLVAAAVVPAAPVAWLAAVRIEVGAVLSIVVELALTLTYGPVPNLSIVPLFSLAVAGLFSSRRAAKAVAGLAISAQAIEMVVLGSRSAGDIGNQIGEMIFLVVAGLCFLEIGAVLRRYQERIAEQSREELRLTEFIAEKDRLIDGVAHELRTPLTVVLGMSSELGSGQVSDLALASDLAATVAEEAMRLAHIIDNLVVSARADIDRLQLVPTELDPATVAMDVWSGFRRDASELRIVGNGRLVADPTRVRHVVENILDNALRHGAMPVTLAISRDDSAVTMTFADAGSGVDPRVEPVLFGRYQAARDEARPGNLGLGLAVARDLARHMSGDLRYTDGAFVLSLPASHAVVNVS